MKTKNLFFIGCIAFFMLATSILSAQTYVAEFRDNPKLWGYINSKGEVILPCQYGGVSPFCPEGIALTKDPVTKVEKYIDIKGNELKLEVNVQNRKEFKDGMAPVKINDLWGFVNLEGKLVVPANYKRINYYSEGKVWVTDIAGKRSLLDKQGNTIDLSKYDITGYNDFSEGLAAVKIGTTWGFIDQSGNLVIENKYLGAGDFKAGLAWVKTGDKQVGYINKKGELVINADYISCEEFDPVSEMARVKSLDMGWHYIDKTGKKLTVNSKRYKDFHEGLCATDNNMDPLKIGYIKKDGTWAIEPQFDAAGDFVDGIATVRVDKLWGLIDKSGKYLIEPKYNNLEDFYLVK